MGRIGMQRDYGHKERVAHKYEALELARAMYETYAERLPEHDPMVMHWKRRVRKLENQLKNMRP